jgi:hypothetical protein
MRHHALSVKLDRMTVCKVRDLAELGRHECAQTVFISAYSAGKNNCE